MFASRSLALHLARGGVGFGAFAVALAVSVEAPLLAVPLFIGGLVALRGCPMCWTMGLFETIANTVQARRHRPDVTLCATCVPMPKAKRM